MLRNPFRRSAPSTPDDRTTPMVTQDPRLYGDFNEAARPAPSLVPQVQDLRDFATHLAVSDAASGMYRDEWLMAHQHLLSAETRLWHQVSAIESVLDDGQREAQAVSKHLLGVARHDLAAAEADLRRGEEELAAAEAERQRQIDILRGALPGEGDGDWAQESAIEVTHTRTVKEITRVRRRQAWTTALVLGLFVVGDIMPIYLALVNVLNFNIQDPTFSALVVWVPTILVCGMTVAAAHGVGIFVKKARRQAHGNGLRWLGAVLLGAAIIASQYFMAAYRSGQKEGVSPWMWMAVVLALALLAAVYAAQHHNPHRRLLISAHRAYLVVRDYVAGLRDRVTELAAATEQRRESAEGVPEHWQARKAALTKEWETLVGIYRHELSRQLGDPQIATAIESTPIVRPDLRTPPPGPVAA